LGAVFAVISSKEKTRAVARGLVPADWAAVLVMAHARSHAVKISLFIEDLSLTAQNMACTRFGRDLGPTALSFASWPTLPCAVIIFSGNGSRNLRKMRLRVPRTFPRLRALDKLNVVAA